MSNPYEEKDKIRWEKQALALKIRDKMIEIYTLSIRDECKEIAEELYRQGYKFTPPENEGK